MTNLSMVKGVGPKTIQLLNKLNLHTVEDLITFYPFRYNVLKETKLDSEIAVVTARVVSVPLAYRIKNNLNRMSFMASVEDRLVNVIIFNRMFLRESLKINKEITLIGKYDQIKNTITASDIKLYPLGGRVRIEPVYHTVSGLSSKIINNYINDSLNLYDRAIEDYIPYLYKEKYNFIEKKHALNEIHNPMTNELLMAAIRRLKYEELFSFMLKINYLKNKSAMGINKQIDRDKVQTFIQKLPFKLTADQELAVKEIVDDLESAKRMNRLLQGDVGSGKTIVSFLGVYGTWLSGFQSAMMVPTEVLANQHYNSAQALFNGQLRVELLTGSTPKVKRTEILEKLKMGEIDFIIGTHALIEKDVIFKNLGLIITDEQHRFGVNQRAMLKNKGVTPDILYLSATPIPRTYALTIYGDLDISNIVTRPTGRKEIITYLKGSNELGFVADLMLQELKLGHQAFVIAPLIEENEVSNLVDIKKLYARINDSFGKAYKVGLMHGKLKSEEKDEVIKQFKDNKIKILVSTTVIEVGVDIPNASVMIIFDAHQFGLATLHQLRGRVGRNSMAAYCVLVSNHEKERLNIMTRTNDGFVISEEDFKLRGHGDLFGVKQSGDMNFKIADIKRDYEMLMKVKDDVDAYINEKKWNDDWLMSKIVKQLETLD